MAYNPAAGWECDQGGLGARDCSSGRPAILDSRTNMGNSIYRLGVVSFLNARPLIEGLDRQSPGVDMVFEVPAALPGLLDRDAVDAALVPVIDFVRPGRDWRILSDACIGCDGETLTVRVFSRVPPEDIRRLHVDGDSHTSVVLASLIWQQMYGTRLLITPYLEDVPEDQCEAVLLIGDKVINHRLMELNIEIDLGGAWKSLTGLPFVFAVWAAKRDRDVGDLAATLALARDRGLVNLERIAETAAPGMGWPVELAKRYLTRRLVFTLRPRLREGLDRFLEMARGSGLVPGAPRTVYA
ncbi:MAG: menaquinone biosynthesis protein [Planctomycetota bacterium]